MDNQEIKETIKIRNGKPIYCLQVKQGDAKMQIYIRDGEIYFEDCHYNFDSYPTFDICNDAHKIAKEMFVSSLKTDIKNKILQLKQLELILDQLNLKDVISDELTKGGLLLTIKKKLLGGKNDEQ
ncbi:MAG: hypothetical protein IJ220_07750 [Clostridia bacterium]|nr:hypothetical protein [Clostridia bacterium]